MIDRRMPAQIGIFNLKFSFAHFQCCYGGSLHAIARSRRTCAALLASPLHELSHKIIGEKKFGNGKRYKIGNTREKKKSKTQYDAIMVHFNKAKSIMCPFSPSLPYLRFTVIRNILSILPISHSVFQIMDFSFRS